MIKVGTLCIIVGVIGPWCGRVVTVLGPLKTLPYTSCSTGQVFIEPAHEITPLDNTCNWVCSPRYLRPLNDPDSAPAGPAYTKRKEHA